MKLTITVHEKRSLPLPYVGATPKYEDYQRVAVADMEGTAAVVAGLLRSIADDVDSQRPVRTGGMA
jgi:hypothetical protein